MNVFGHHHVANQLEPVFVSCLAKDSNEESARPCGREKRKAAIATEGNEVQMPITVNAFEFFRHVFRGRSGSDKKAPRSQTEHGAPAKTSRPRVRVVLCARYASLATEE